MTKCKTLSIVSGLTPNSSYTSTLHNNMKHVTQWAYHCRSFQIHHHPTKSKERTQSTFFLPPPLPLSSSSKSYSSIVKNDSPPPTYPDLFQTICKFLPSILIRSLNSDTPFSINVRLRFTCFPCRAPHNAKGTSNGPVANNATSSDFARAFLISSLSVVISRSYSVAVRRPCRCDGFAWRAKWLNCYETRVHHDKQNASLHLFHNIR